MSCAASSTLFHHLKRQLSPDITSTDPQTPVSRWSNTNLCPPAIIVTPRNESDIIATLRAATQIKGDHTDLKVIPVSGTHGTFVPITSSTIYLDLHCFTSTDLSPEAGSVEIGGGVITGDVLSSLGEKGWYTCIPNSNAVGMIGFCLGGGSSPFNGWKGLAIDNILSIRLITADGRTVVIDVPSLTTTPIPSTEHVEKEGGTQGHDSVSLFNVLCGAGFGFGIITSITLRAWPISELRLLPAPPSDAAKHQDDTATTSTHVWTRRLLFPPKYISQAAALFTTLQTPASPYLTTTLIFMRAPPTHPSPLTPLILLTISFFGPSSQATAAATPTFSPDILSRTIPFPNPTSPQTTTLPFASLNDATNPLNRHDGANKEMHAAWHSRLSAQAIERAFTRWLDFGETTPEARATSFFVLAAKSTKGMVERDVQGEKFFPRTLRGKGVFVQVTPWWVGGGGGDEVEGKARRWGREMLEILSEGEVGAKKIALGKEEQEDEEDRLSAWAANLTPGMDLSTVWTSRQREEIRRVKGIWDPKGLFWNPVVDGV